MVNTDPGLKTGSSNSAFRKGAPAKAFMMRLDFPGKASHGSLGKRFT